MTTHEMIEAIEETNRTWQPLSLPVRNKIAQRLDELERENARLRHELTVADNWVKHHEAHVNDLIEENVRLRGWIDGLDMLAANNGEHREWGGGMGWVYPGAAVYYAATKRDDILANVSGHLSLPVAGSVPVERSGTSTERDAGRD